MLYMVRTCDIDPYNDCAGMNSGVLLMRNTDWMRDLIQQMTHYGTHPMNMTREEVKADFGSSTAMLYSSQSCAHAMQCHALCNPIDLCWMPFQSDCMACLCSI